MSQSQTLVNGQRFGMTHLAPSPRCRAPEMTRKGQSSREQIPDRAAGSCVSGSLQEFGARNLSSRKYRSHRDNHANNPCCPALAKVLRSHSRMLLGLSSRLRYVAILAAILALDLADWDPEDVCLLTRRTWPRQLTEFWDSITPASNMAPSPANTPIRT